MDKTAAGLVDLHSHLLPGVDDGARSLEEALRHLERMVAEGVKRIAISPHLNGYLAREPESYAERVEQLAAAFEQVRAAAAARFDGDGRAPALEFSQELLLPDSEALVPGLLTDSRVGIGGTRYVLVEFGFDVPIDAHVLLAALRAAGRRPVIAHPERYRRNGQPVRVAEVRGWRATGALLQINAGSLLGRYGPGPERVAWELIASGLADLLASDHHADNGPVSLAEAAAALAAAGGHEQARLLAAENPGRVLEDGEPLPVPPLLRRRAA